MNKPERFRTALHAALPELVSDPQRLSIFVEKGKLVANGTEGAGWQYSYQLTAILQDFAGDMDTVATAVIAWVVTEQPDMLKNPAQADRGIRFECELMTAELADVSIEIDLTEAVFADNDGTFDHPVEPPADPTSDWLWPTT
jgi:tail completion protein R (GpR)